MSAKQFGIFKEIFISKYGNSLNWKNWKGLRTIEIKFYRSIMYPYTKDAPLWKPLTSPNRSLLAIFQRWSLCWSFTIGKYYLQTSSRGTKNRSKGNHRLPYLRITACNLWCTVIQRLVAFLPYWTIWTRTVLSFTNVSIGQYSTQQDSDRPPTPNYWRTVLQFLVHQKSTRLHSGRYTKPRQQFSVHWNRCHNGERI